MAAGLVGLGLSIVLAGRAITPDADSFPRPNAESETVDSPGTTASQTAATSLPASDQPARPIGKDLVAQPEVKSETLVREEARAPLSKLGQALPPPKPDVMLFYQPVATASATFESMGYKLAIAGTESVDPDETCTHNGVAWACGVRARAAVRLWLRGRALSCKSPQETGHDIIAIGCHLGKEDVGAWLVSNGWARAADGGSYAEAEAKARQAGLGIFGPPPAVTN
jgi:endonuclease YncB( thermonuclease family)